MKTGKKLVIGCGGVVAIAILGIASLFLLVSAKKSKYDRIAVPFLEESIPVLSTWNSDMFESFWAAEVKEKVEPERMKKLFGMYQKLGDLKSYNEPQFQQVMASTGNPYGSFVTYSIIAEYENGKARITCVLVPTKSDGLKYWKLQINSDAFLDPIDDSPKTESI